MTLLPQLPSTPTVNNDMTCGTCGYNLRGLSPDGRCPECGHPIEESRYDPRLAAADPRWLRAIRRGFTILLVSEFATAAARLLGYAIVTTYLAYQAMVITWFIGVTLYSLGSWIVASRDCVCPPMFDPRHLRRVVRVCAVVVWTAMLIWTIATFTGNLSPHGTLLILALMICCLSGDACLFLLLRRFARRIPAPALAWASTSLLFFVPTTVAVGLGLNMVYQVLVAIGHPNPIAVYESTAGHAIRTILTVTGWISLVALSVVFFWFRRRLSALLSQARQAASERLRATASGSQKDA
ncbi:MAG: hypothetical protein JXB13_08335 [Phycisphaerae bacterium]|nr:hypothetical protein [Phycisphaerae bacterium]